MWAFLRGPISRSVRLLRMCRHAGSVSAVQQEMDIPRGDVMNDATRTRRSGTKWEKPKDKALAFGNVFTAHMFVMAFQEEKGWYDPRVEPYGPFPMDPATAVLHYGQGLFEGLKAFRGRDGKIRLFRPQKHVERLNRTAERMCIPTLDPEMVLKSWTTLVDVDRDWTPSSVGTSLYVRPTIVASEPFLGVRPAKQYLYFVIISPVGPYYPEGMRPVKIDEVREAASKGTLKEVWGTGTAAVISPVGELAFQRDRIVVNGGRIGELTQRLYDTIVGIQYGTAPDPRGWTVTV